MNENKRLLALFGAVLIIVVIVLVVNFWPEPDKTFACGVKKDEDYSKLAAINYEDYECLKDESSVVLASGDLSKKEKSNLNNVATESGIGIYYLSNDISKEDLEKIQKDLKYKDKAFEEDVLLVLDKDKVINYKENVFSNKDDIYNFLDEAGALSFACGIKSSEDYENLGEADYEDYECLLNSDKPFALVIAQTTCSYCHEFAPIIDEYALNNDIPVYIIYLDKISSDEVNELTSLAYFNENSNWGTPLTLGIKNKEVVANISGYTDDESRIDEFFETLGLK